MTGSETTAEAAALMRGRREGYATAALAASCVGFINLLGMEKALLAMALAAMAIGGLPAGAARSRALAAFGLGGVYIVTIVAVVTVYHDKLLHLLALLKDLA